MHFHLGNVNLHVEIGFVWRELTQFLDRCGISYSLKDEPDGAHSPSASPIEANTISVSAGIFASIDSSRDWR
jgi:hypothetical protein